MLPKKNRIDKKTADLIFKSGSFLGSKNISFKFIKENSNISRISFVAPKALFKKAVKRNSLRRKGYLALVDNLSSLPRGILGMFIFNRNIESEKEIEDEIKKIINKIH